MKSSSASTTTTRASTYRKLHNLLDDSSIQQITSLLPAPTAHFSEYEQDRSESVSARNSSTDVMTRAGTGSKQQRTTFRYKEKQPNGASTPSSSSVDEPRKITLAGCGDDCSDFYATVESPVQPGSSWKQARSKQAGMQDRATRALLRAYPSVTEEHPEVSCERAKLCMALLAQGRPAYWLEPARDASAGGSSAAASGAGGGDQAGPPVAKMVPKFSIEWGIAPAKLLRRIACFSHETAAWIVSSFASMGEAASKTDCHQAWNTVVDLYGKCKPEWPDEAFVPSAAFNLLESALKPIGPGALPPPPDEARAVQSREDILSMGAAIARGERCFACLPDGGLEVVRFGQLDFPLPPGLVVACRIPSDQDEHEWVRGPLSTIFESGTHITSAEGTLLVATHIHRLYSAPKGEPVSLKFTQIRGLVTSWQWAATARTTSSNAVLAAVETAARAGRGCKLMQYHASIRSWAEVPANSIDESCALMTESAPVACRCPITHRWVVSSFPELERLSNLQLMSSCVSRGLDRIRKIYYRDPIEPRGSVTAGLPHGQPTLTAYAMVCADMNDLHINSAATAKSILHGAPLVCLRNGEAAWFSKVAEGEAPVRFACLSEQRQHWLVSTVGSICAAFGDERIDLPTFKRVVQLVSPASNIGQPGSLYSRLRKEVLTVGCSSTAGTTSGLRETLSQGSSKLPDVLAALIADGAPCVAMDPDTGDVATVRPRSLHWWNDAVVSPIACWCEISDEWVVGTFTEMFRNINELKGESVVPWAIIEKRFWATSNEPYHDYFSPSRPRFGSVRFKYTRQTTEVSDPICFTEKKLATGDDCSSSVRPRESCESVVIETQQRRPPALSGNEGGGRPAAALKFPGSEIPRSPTSVVGAKGVQSTRTTTARRTASVDSRGRTRGFNWIVGRKRRRSLLEIARVLDSGPPAFNLTHDLQYRCIHVADQMIQGTPVFWHVSEQSKARRRVKELTRTQLGQPLACYHSNPEGKKLLVLVTSMRHLLWANRASGGSRVTAMILERMFVKDTEPMRAAVTSDSPDLASDEVKDAAHAAGGHGAATPVVGKQSTTSTATAGGAATRDLGRSKASERGLYWNVSPLQSSSSSASSSSPGSVAAFEMAGGQSALQSLGAACWEATNVRAGSPARSSNASDPGAALEPCLGSIAEGASESGARPDSASLEF